MEKIKMEEVRRKRGRPKPDARINEEYAPSRRQALNKMYMYEGVHLLSVVAAEIQNSEVLWHQVTRCYVPLRRGGKKQDAGKIQCRDLLQAQPGR